jgi:hypothetical protein
MLLNQKTISGLHGQLMPPAPFREKASQHRGFLRLRDMRVGKIGKKRLTLDVFKDDIWSLSADEVFVLKPFKDVKPVLTPSLKHAFFGFDSVQRMQRGFSSQEIGERARDLTPFAPLSAIRLDDVSAAAGILDQENPVATIAPLAGIQACCSQILLIFSQNAPSGV